MSALLLVMVLCWVLSCVSLGVAIRLWREDAARTAVVRDRIRRLRDD